MFECYNIPLLEISRISLVKVRITCHFLSPFCSFALNFHNFISKCFPCVGNSHTCKLLLPVYYCQLLSYVEINFSPISGLNYQTSLIPLHYYFQIDGVKFTILEVLSPTLQLYASLHSLRLDPVFLFPGNVIIYWLKMLSGMF